MSDRDSPSNHEITVIIEPFCGGSHKQLVQVLQTKIFPSTTTLLLTLPDKKWKWYVITNEKKII